MENNTTVELFDTDGRVATVATSIQGGCRVNVNLFNGMVPVEPAGAYPYYIGAPGEPKPGTRGTAKKPKNS